MSETPGTPATPAGRRGRFPVALPEFLLLLAASIAGAVAVTWPLATRMNSAILGSGGDALGAIWWIWRAADSGLPLIGETRHVDIGAPFGFAEGNGVNVIWSLVGVPTVAAAEVVGELPAYNLMILFGIASAGVAMYLLVRRLGARPWAAAWAGLVYTVFPWHLEKAQGHGALATIYLFPVLLWAGLLWYERPTRRRALLLGAVNLLLWLVAGYFGVVAAVATLAFVVLSLRRHRAELGTRRALGRAGLAVGAMGLGALLVMVLVRLGAGPASTLPERTDIELTTYGARLHEYLVPSYRNVLVGDEIDGWVVANLHGSNPSESTLFLGYLTLLLAAAFFIVGAARRAYGLEGRFASAVLPWVALVAVACTLPSPVTVAGIETVSPSGVIHALVPSFRVPTRFMPLIIGCLIPAAALMLDWILGAVARRTAGRGVTTRRAAVAGVALAAGTFSFLELSQTPPANVNRVDRVPAEYAALRSVPPGTLAEYPLYSAAAAMNSDYLFWQRIHGRPLLTGGADGTFATAVRDSLVNPADPTTQSVLALLGVTGVVVRQPIAIPPVVVPDDLGPGMVKVAQPGGGAPVWRVAARPAEAFTTFGEGFGPSEIPGPTATARWMGATGEITLFATRAGTYRATFPISSYGPPRAVTFTGTNAGTLTVSSKKVSLAVTLPKGFSRITVTTDPGVQPLPDGRLATVYMSNWRLVRADGAGIDAPRVTAAPITPPADVVRASLPAPGRG